MKKGLKILSTVLLLGILVFGVNQARAEQQTETVMATVSYIEYNHDSKTYFAITDSELGGGYWALSIIKGSEFDDSLLNALHANLSGHNVQIEYDTNDSTNSDDWNVLGWEVKP